MSEEIQTQPQTSQEAYFYDVKYIKQSRNHFLLFYAMVKTYPGPQIIFILTFQKIVISKVEKWEEVHFITP